MSLNVNEIIALRLRTLRDIEGVLGSFLVGERGELLGRDVTAACGSDVLALVSGRLQQLCDAFRSAAIGGAFESTTLYFPSYKLHVRAFSNVFIVAVVSAEVNLPALKMAVNMLSRQLLADLADPRWTVEAARVAEAAARQLQQAREPFDPPARMAHPPPQPARTSHAPATPRSTIRASVAAAAPEPARPSNVPPSSAARASSVPPPPPAVRSPSVLQPSATDASAQALASRAARATRTSSPPPPPVPARDSRTSVAAHAARATQIGYAPPSRDSHESLRPSRSPEQQPGRESSVPPRSFRGTRVAH